MNNQNKNTGIATRSLGVIELDGASGEGGGQILRTGLALAMCTRQPVRFSRIRAGRAKPGLMRQHLACVQAAAAVSGAQVEGAELGSQTLVFTPGDVRAGEYRFDVGSAGSCTLVLQTVLPALMSAAGESQITLTGGTHNPMAPPFHFLQRCFAPLLARLGVGLELALVRHGFYPAGGGRFTARIVPAARLVPVDVLTRGERLDAFAECLTPGIPGRVAAQELAVLAERLGWPRDKLLHGDARQDEGPGNALMATLAHTGVTELFTAFGEKGRPAEQVAGELVREVRAYIASEGALGEHLTDQWMLPLALAVQASGQPAAFTCTELSLHARTQIETVSAFLPVRFAAEQLHRAWHVTVSPA
ncbi:RNA 3'-terminal phosphate cyclase [Roseateles sp. BYS96W]|uniref:RNA 3'-terminal phosphate cyclase n=1 Tax=Pelomonas nitida TaxID=3299027 RepID=A0ABW7G6F9_9BURK